jgi:hypothetical protein
MLQREQGIQNKLVVRGESMQITLHLPNSRGASQSELFARHHRLFAVAGTGLGGRLHWPEFPTPECTFWKLPERKMAERGCPKEIARTKLLK